MLWTFLSPVKHGKVPATPASWDFDFIWMQKRIPEMEPREPYWSLTFSAKAPLEDAPMGHVRHDLSSCFDLHLNYLRYGAMLPDLDLTIFEPHRVLQAK